MPLGLNSPAAPVGTEGNFIKNTQPHNIIHHIGPQSSKEQKENIILECVHAQRLNIIFGYHEGEGKN